MPPFPVPSHGLDRGFVTGPHSPREADREAWAAWEAHLDAGRIGAAHGTGSVTLERDGSTVNLAAEIASPFKS